MTPRYAPDCPHRCCTEPDDAPPHDHPTNAAECPECDALADVHPLAKKALEIGSGRHPELAPNEQENENDG